MAPDGESLVYASNQSGEYEIYEMNLTTFESVQLTSRLGESYGPEISPDGSQIVFAVNVRVNDVSSIWIMERDGGNPHMIFRQEGSDAIDPTWSPDGTRILFALGVANAKLLHTMDTNGGDLQMVSDDLRVRGRSDWSADGAIIGAYSGSAPYWSVWFISPDGTNLREMTTSGRDLAPSFSPDSQWMVYTSYGGDNYNLDACEIYIMRVDGSQNTRLTENSYCDWQPRWGP
jgi:TolB protein